MNPNQVMQEYSCHFVHAKLLKLGASFIPGGSTALALAGSLVSKRTRRAAQMPAAVISSAQAARNAAMLDPRFLTPAAMAADVVGHIKHGHIPGLPGGHAFTEKFLAPPPTSTGSNGCIVPGMKRDPISGDCRFFVGDQAGPDGGGQAVAGAFGMPAIVPDAESVTRLSCPAGMVLGRDNLCYPKAVLRRDSKFRKWRPGMRPILTGGERHGIAKAKRSTNKARVAVGLAPLK